MSEYPLSHFLEAATFRKMIALRMPDTAAGIYKNRERVIRQVDNVSGDIRDVGLLESKSRPNLGKYGYKASIYEKSEISMNKTIIDTDYSRDMMVASTKSQEENFCKSSKIFNHFFANGTFLCSLQSHRNRLGRTDMMNSILRLVEVLASCYRRNEQRKTSTKHQISSKIQAIGPALILSLSPDLAQEQVQTLDPDLLERVPKASKTQ